jgi:hypothetical protein
MTARGADLGRFSFAWPRADAVLAVWVTGWLLLATIAAGAFWLLSSLTRELRPPGGAPPFERRPGDE